MGYNKSPWTRVDTVLSGTAVFSLLAFGLAIAIPGMSVMAGGVMDGLHESDWFSFVPSNKDVGIFMSPETFMEIAKNKPVQAVVATLGGVGALAHMIQIARGRH